MVTCDRTAMRCWFLAGLLVLARGLHGADSLNLLPELAEVRESGAPRGWPEGNGMRYAMEDGKPVVVATRPNAGADLALVLPVGCRVLRLDGQVRVQDVRGGAEDWQTGRITVEFLDGKDGPVGGWPRQHGFLGTSGWQTVSCVYQVPEGAVKVRVGLVNLGVSGEVLFRDMSLAPVDMESLTDAFRLVTDSRVRASLNGYWRCRPSFERESASVLPPEDDCWGWARLPSAWERGRKPFPAAEMPAPAVAARPERFSCRQNVAWYRRRFRLPEESGSRRVSLAFDMVQSRVDVWVNGQSAGSAVFPDGEVDITPFVRPAEMQVVDLRVTAGIAEKGTQEFNAPDRVEVKAADMPNQGLTGDVWLDVGPTGGRICDATAYLEPDGRVVFQAETAGLPNGTYVLEAELVPARGGAAMRFSDRVSCGPDGCLRLVADGARIRRWDTHTPEIRYDVRLSVRRPDGELVDAGLPFACGFRTLELRGRDLLLNGKPLHLRVATNGNMAWGEGSAAKESCLDACRALLSRGYNFVIASNYSIRPGSVCQFEGMLDACDETGLGFSFTLPHACDFDWRLDEPAVSARYRRLAERLIRRVRNHPSVLLYAMNHNSTGYASDQDPLATDGRTPPVFGACDATGSWNPARNRRQAHLAWTLVRGLDATRPIYHHESGALDDFYTLNIYLNWAPVQERSDWLEHWHDAGAKPMFFVEWGLPHVASWSSNRGPGFIWSDPLCQSAWTAEYAAAVRGELAYEGDEVAAEALRLEETAWKTGKPFHFGEIIAGVRKQTNNYWGVQAAYAADNLRSLRAWGITALLPWDQDDFFERRHSVPCRPVPGCRRDAKRPGLAVERVQPQWPDRAAWDPTPVGREIERWFAPDCGWIAGTAGLSFTEKSHVFRPNRTIGKTLMVLNDRRESQNVRWTVALEGGQIQTGRVSVAAGEQARIPFALRLPAREGEHVVRAEFEFEGGVRQVDAFRVSTVGPAARPDDPVDLYDEKGVTEKDFKRLGVRVRRFGHAWPTPESSCGRTVVVGRESLSRAMFEEDVVPYARNGGRVLICEQRKDVLEALGFRVQEYGLRKCFARYREDAVGVLSDEHLRDWAGESTLLAPYREEIEGRNDQPSATWAGFRNSRVWRCRNRGAVATVLPEKPTCGDWCALVDGGFDLQYAPVLDWHVGSGCIRFCQLDVSGRTESDPAADDMLVSLLRFGSKAKAPNGGRLVRSGETLDETLVEYVRTGGTLLCAGLNAGEVRRLWPDARVEDRKGVCYGRIERLPEELNGLSNADWAWHGTLDFAAFTDTCETGNSAIRIVRMGKGRLVFWQVPPWRIDDGARPYLRTSRRRAEFAFSRVKANLGVVSDEPPGIRYADVPQPTDDPYRYYRW